MELRATRYRALGWRVRRALGRAARLGWRRALVAGLATLLALLNPVLCVIHCMVLHAHHSAGHAAHAHHSAEHAAHAGHSAAQALAHRGAGLDTPGHSDAAPDVAPCPLQQAKSSGPPAPQALYELAPLAGLLLALLLLPMRVFPLAGFVLHPRDPGRPPTPPPRLLALP